MTAPDFKSGSAGDIKTNKMNKALFGLAFLSYNWETHKRDILDSYIPLFAEIVSTKGYNKISRDIVKADLLEEFGINMPLGAIEGVINRMIKEGIFTREQGLYLVVHSNIKKWLNNTHKEEINNSFEETISAIRGYSKTEFNLNFSISDIENGLIGFLKENDLDLLFASTNSESIVPNVVESKKLRYVIAKFVNYIQKFDQGKFNNLVKLAKGYSIASLITYEDIQSYSGKLDKVEVFLDAPIFFNLLGLNGESNLNSSVELIEILKRNGAKLRVFEINYEEVVKTIQAAVNRLQTGNYDLSISSRVLRTAIRENISASHLQVKLNQLESIFDTYKIDKTQPPSLSTFERRYQIDEAKLSFNIKELYTKTGYENIPWWKTDQIERDVLAISGIFKIRQNNLAISLKNCKSLLLTTNDSIAFAAKKYESTDWKWKSVIPPCMSDVFLSTILWANYPVKNDNLKIKQLISSCYSITELDNRLLNKFIADIKKMHIENKISTEQFYLLNASHLTYNLLEKRTLNDFEEYTDKTPNEVLEDLQIKIQQDAELERDRISRVEQKLEKISTFLAKSIFIIIGAAIIGLSLLFRVLNPKFDGGIVNIFLWILAALLSIFGFLRWFELIPTKVKIETTIENWLYKNFKQIINLR